MIETIILQRLCLRKHQRKDSLKGHDLWNKENVLPLLKNSTKLFYLKALLNYDGINEIPVFLNFNNTFFSYNYNILFVCPFHICVFFALTYTGTQDELFAKYIKSV